MNEIHSELNKKRILSRSMNDQVEILHLTLMHAPEGSYSCFLEAIYDEEAEEGSLILDSAVAAIAIRDAARRDPRFDKVEKAKLADIIKALKVVLRRYGMSRSERLFEVQDKMEGKS